MKNWKYINGAEGIVVGNDSLTTSIEKGRLGLYNWFVHKNGSIVAGGTTKTESEAKAEAEKALQREKVGNADVKETHISGKNGSGVITRMSNLFFAAYKLNGGEKGIEKFNTESEAVKFLKTKVGNSEIGNELNTGDFFKRLAADAHKEETRDNEKLNEIGNAKSIYPWDQNKWREIVKDPSGYSKDVVEAAKRSLYMLEHKGRAPEDDKVGNSDSLIGKTVWVRLSDGHKYKAEVLRDEGSRIYVKTPEGNQTWKLKREVEVLNEDSYEAWKNKPTKKISNSVHNLFLKFPSYEEAEDYINTKLKNKYKSVKVISKPHNGNGTYEIVAED